MKAKILPRTPTAVESFFLKLGPTMIEAEARCQWTEPLFPLWLILAADGTLRDDCREIVDRTQA